MQKFILLFRAINVGGNNLLPMKEFVTLLKNHNYKSVSYYIQSGNIILMSDKNPTNHIQTLVTENYGFSPDIFVLTSIEFLTAYASNPYTKYQGKFVHSYFCKDKIVLNKEKIRRLAATTEEYIVKDNVFYLHAPEGIGKSKLVANIAACLNQQATGRNLNTINKIHTLMVREI